MKTIGEIALLILNECSDAAITNSICYCVSDLVSLGKLTAEERDLFNVAIVGWQAAGVRPAELAYIPVLEDGKLTGKITRIKNDEVKCSYRVYIKEPFEVKRQWLVNLAIMHM